jgi:hypothetical protein
VSSLVLALRYVIPNTSEKIRYSSQLKTSSIYVALQTAACMKMLEELCEAAEVYKHSTTLELLLIWFSKTSASLLYGSADPLSGASSHF